MTPLGSNLVDLHPYVALDRVVFLQEGLNKEQALQRLATTTAAHPDVRDAAAFATAITERERVSSTGIGGGIAVPHAKIASVYGFVISFGISHSGLAYQAKDDRPVHILVMIAASDQERDTYLKVLATVASRLKQPQLVDQLLTASGPAEVLAAFVD